MKKIAFIAVRYGIEVNGGAEVHCRMLAERLRPFFDVEVLTTTIRVFGDPSQDYPVGESTENGVLVRRFRPQPEHREQTAGLKRQSKAATQLRFTLFNLRLLRPLAALHPRWTMRLEAEQRLLRTHEEYSPEMLHFIETHKDEYAAFIPLCYFYATNVLSALIVPEKTILIPTAHQEKPLFASVYSHLFTRVRHIAFNTGAEKRLCQRAFGRAMAPSSIVGAGTDPSPAADWDTVKAKYNLPDEYVLYLGRVGRRKLRTLIPDFRYFREKYAPQATLVLVGGISPEIKPCGEPGFVFTGFVSDEEKSAIIRHATVMVNPSKHESLSLLVLEAMENRVPAVVNGACEVMKDHCLQSGAAIFYKDKKGFCRQLGRLLSDPGLRRTMGDKGPAYLEKQYNWETIIGKLRTLIESM